MLERANAPAFPTSGGQTGLTIREYFAARAMAALLADPKCEMNSQDVASYAVHQADTLILTLANIAVADPGH